MRIVLVMYFLLGSMVAFAKVHTVSNNPSTLAQFSTIQSAINASDSGDTIYVHGSSILYPAFVVDGKGIVIIGPGWRPDKNQPLRALINQGVEIRGSNSSNTELNGLVFTGSVSFIDGVSPGDSDGGGADNIRMIRNEFRSTTIIYGGAISIASFSNHLYEGCYFSNVSMHVGGGRGPIPGHSYNNFILRNNIFRDCTISSFVSTNNFLFDHNLFYSSTSRRVFCQCEFLLFTNNIFNKANVLQSSCGDAFRGINSCTFTSNITFQVGGVADTPWISNGNIDAGGNVANQNPLMANQLNVDAGDDNPLLNFTIAAGPGNNSGTDGKDMGLLFDVSGGANWSNCHTSRLARIFKMNIGTPVIAPGGTLTVTIDARKSN
jgi:hypothetical protein